MLDPNFSEKTFLRINVNFISIDDEAVAHPITYPALLTHKVSYGWYDSSVEISPLAFDSHQNPGSKLQFRLHPSSISVFPSSHSSSGCNRIPSPQMMLQIRGEVEVLPEAQVQPERVDLQSDEHPQKASQISVGAR
jgi:hypothetical protein